MIGAAIAKKGCGRRAGVLASFVAIVVASSATTLTLFPPSARAQDDREQRAQKYFAAGKYQEALDLLAKLYAETLHPTYLRNIGRCYQRMKEPEKALESFRAYLRVATNLPASTRAEVQGFIEEMEALKRLRDGARVGAPPQKAPPAVLPPPAHPAPAAAPAPTPERKLAISQPRSASETAPSSPALVFQPGPTPARDDGDRHSTWIWIAGGGALLVAAAVTTFLLLRTGDDGISCPECKLPSRRIGDK